MIRETNNNLVADRSSGLGARMLKYRALTGKSQRACAAESRISLQTWYSVENGYQSPSKVTAEKINLLIHEVVSDGEEAGL